jgi:ATP synthase protein I
MGMDNHHPKEPQKQLAETVGKKEARKIKARKEKDRGVWFGLGMFGLVGWAVAVPTLIGIAVGVWIDKTFASPHSWTLMGLFIGVVLGCLNAWYWVNRESRRE